MTFDLGGANVGSKRLSAGQQPILPVRKVREELR
jgi:hypothetical protein